MRRAASSASASDKERRAQVEARNNAEALIHATEKSISENQHKIDAADKDAAEAAMAELKTALEGEDMDAINEKAQALSQAAMKIGEAVYQAQQAESEAAAAKDAASDAANDAGDDGNVVDAEFEEVTEDDGKENDDKEADGDQKAS